MPTLGWDRAYRSGDLVRVRRRGPGLRWAAPTTRSSSAAAGSSSARSTARCSALPGVTGAAAAVRTTAAGNQLLVGYVAVDRRRSTSRRRRPRSAHRCPPPLVPAAGRGRRRCRPAPPARSTATRCRGRCDRVGTGQAAGRSSPARRPGSPTCGSRCSARRSTDRGRRLLRPRRRQPDRGPARVPAAERFPEVTVADIYENPTLGAPRRRAGRMAAPPPPATATGPPVPRQDPDRPGSSSPIPLRTLTGLRWLAWVAAAATTWPPRCSGLDWLPTCSWWWVGARAGCCWSVRRAGWRSRAVGARLLLRGVAPGRLPARRQDRTCGSGSPSASPTSCGAANLAGAPP